MDSAPTPGTAAYFPSLLSRIHKAHPDLPLDPVIVQSLLLCLVASDVGANTHISSHSSKNLVLRTREEDIGLVASLTELVSNAHGFVHSADLLWQKLSNAAHASFMSVPSAHGVSGYITPHIHMHG